VSLGHTQWPGTRFSWDLGVVFDFQFSSLIRVKSSLINEISGRRSESNCVFFGAPGFVLFCFQYLVLNSGPPLARQVLYHLSSPSFSYFSLNRVFLILLLGSAWTAIRLFTPPLGITGRHHRHEQIYWLRCAPDNFLPRLAWSIVFG
jgi:hypothetical protein